MADAASVSTKLTQLSNSNGLPKKTSKSKNTDWRLFVRDAFANIFDLVGDWVYFYAIYNRDLDGDGFEDAIGPLNIDWTLCLYLALSFCILSTILSVFMVILALRRKAGLGGSCNCTVTRLSMAELIIEDVPQFILTSYIDYKFVGQLTPAGMLNICSSLTGLVTRATTYYGDLSDDDDIQMKIATSYREIEEE